MCHNPHSHYSLRDNLVNWFACAIIAHILNYVSRQPQLVDDYTVTWAAGMSFGLLLMWAIEIGREWVKTWRVTP